VLGLQVAILPHEGQELVPDPTTTVPKSNDISWMQWYYVGVFKNRGKTPKMDGVL